MGQAHSSGPLLAPPPLSDASDISEGDDILLLDSILGNKDRDEEKEEEVSIVFFGQEEEDVHEDDIYYDERNACDVEDYKCFGLPLAWISSHSKAVTVATAIAKATTQPALDSNTVNEDGDDDPNQDISSLQLELNVIDAIYKQIPKSKNAVKSSCEEKEEEVEEEAVQKEDKNEIKDELEDEDDDPKENVEALQRELQQAEDNYVPSKKKSSETNDCASTKSSSSRQASPHSSSFANVQQLLFASDDSTSKGEGSVSSYASLFSSSTSSQCRVVEIYETRSTQLRPQPDHEKEQVPLERRGVPFRKCRNPHCSCHHSKGRNRGHKTTHRDRRKAFLEQYHATNHRYDEGGDSLREDRSQHRNRNRAIIEKYHTNHNSMDSEEENSSISSQLKRKNALNRLKSQSEKLLAMDHNDGDDHTEVTAGSSTSSRYSSGYSIRSDCPINSRKNHCLMNDRSHRRQRSLSEDWEHRFQQAEFSSKEDAHLQKSDPIPQQLMSPLSVVSNDSHRKPLAKQPTTPPIPLRRPFGENSNHKHTTYPSSLPKSTKLIQKTSSNDDGTNMKPRRFRSEDFVDGSDFQSACTIFASSGTRKLSQDFSTSRNDMFQTNKSKQQQSTDLPFRLSGSFESHHSNAYGDYNSNMQGKEITNRIVVASTVSPTSIMEEVHQRKDSCPKTNTTPRSRTTQHQQGDLFACSPHSRSQTAFSESPARRRTSTPSQGDKDDKTLFDEREKCLKEYRQSIRILQNEEKMDRRQKLSSPTRGSKTLRKHSRNQQKRKRQQDQQREFQRAMQLGDLYHNMGLIHYQQGRFETARHVLQCGVDVLISHRVTLIPIGGNAEFFTFEETMDTDPFDDDYTSPYYAAAPSKDLPLLPTLDEVAPHLANSALLLLAELVMAQAKIFAVQGAWNDTKRLSGKILQWSAFQQQRFFSQQSPEKSHRYWKEWGPATARAQVLFARCFEKEGRPDIAMGYCQSALSVQRSVLGPGHIQTADTLYRMGNLYATSGILAMAGQCYDEALCLYRRHRTATTSHRKTKPNDANANPSCVAADEATALAGLGWIFWVQRDRERALSFTSEALERMVVALGPTHPNVFSLTHHLACVQNSFATSQQRNPRRVAY